jgi:glycosyltransferase A (GT-A) superfamily protein (DUF2064 family)
MTVPPSVRTPDSNFEQLEDFPHPPRYVEIDGLRMHYVDVGPADGPLLLMGTDAPALDAARLHAAAAALQQHAAVFVPAHDGGYALVGLRGADAAPALLAALFAGMHWSTPQVMAHTRARLAAVGVAHAELPAVHDIDEPADLQHLPAGLVHPLHRTPAP